MAAKHLEIARTEGPKAGFNAWITQMERSGLPQVQERLAEVRSQGNKKAQFEYYCNVYGNKIFGGSTRNAGTTEVKPEPVAVGDDVQALFAQFLAAIGGAPATGATEDEDDLDDDDVEAIIAEHGGMQTRTTTRSSGARTRSNATNDDPFAPRNPQDDATSGRLWRLNELGLLQIRNKPGAHITNGQAHEILKAKLA